MKNTKSPGGKYYSFVFSNHYLEIVFTDWLLVFFINSPTENGDHNFVKTLLKVIQLPFAF